MVVLQKSGRRLLLSGSKGKHWNLDAILYLKLFMFIENCLLQYWRQIALRLQNCTENAAVFLNPCFDRLSCFSRKFDFSWNMHSKCVHFIIRKKTKIALQVLLCFAIALYLIKLVSVGMNAFSTVASIFIVVFCNWQLAKPQILSKHSYSRW